MPTFEPWVIEGIRAGGWALVPFLVAAVVWLARKLDERESARAAADAAHMKTVEGLVPVVRDVTRSLDAMSRRLEGMDLIVREDAALARARHERAR